MAIASKIRDAQVVVIDELNLPKPQTKEMAAILKALNLSGEIGRASCRERVYSSV